MKKKKFIEIGYLYMSSNLWRNQQLLKFVYL